MFCDRGQKIKMEERLIAVEHFLPGRVPCAVFAVCAVDIIILIVEHMAVVVNQRGEHVVQIDHTLVVEREFYLVLRVDRADLFSGAR